jgi:transposase
MAFIRKKKIKGNSYYYLVENTRVGKKTIQKVLEYLGTAESLVEAKKMAVPDEAIKNIDVLDIVSYGLPVALLAVSKRLRLQSIVDEHIPKGGGLRPGLTTMLLAINRVDDPVSKSKVQHWFERTALKNLIRMPPEKLSCQNLCHLLDYMTPKRVMNIELDLVSWYSQEFDIPLDCFVYDITSTYTFGSIDGLSARGYSRDHRGDLEQVNIGLIVTRKAFFPVLHFIFEGNVTDVDTLPNTAQLFKQHMSDSPLTLVYDRGMLSDKNVRMLDDNTPYDYICGLKMNIVAVKDAVLNRKENGIWELLKAVDEEHFVYGSETVTELFGKKRKIIVCYSEEKAETQRTNRDKMIDKAVNALEVLKEKTEKRRYSHDNLVIALHKILDGKKKYFKVKIEDSGKGFTFKYKKHKDAEEMDQRLFRWADKKLEGLKKATEKAPIPKKELNVKLEEVLASVKGHYRVTPKEVKERSTFSYKLKTKTLRSTEALDGFYALMSTNLDVMMDEVLDVYECKDGIEKAFYTIKHPIRVRPIRHWNPQRVKGHIFVCVLGYLLWATMRYILKLEKYEHNINDAVRSLRDVQGYTVRFKDSGKDYRRIAGLDGEPTRILDMIGADKFRSEYLTS